MSKKNKKNSKKTIYLILVLILGISVGYAALSATLKINGTSIIKSAKWSVHFGTEANDIQVTSGSVTGDNVTTPARIKADTSNTEIEFSVNLPEPGDFYEFTAQVVNDGSLDAVIGGDGTPVTLSVTAHELNDGEEGDLIPENSTTEPAVLGWSKYFSYSVEWADLEETATRTDFTPIVGDKLAAPASGSTRTARPIKVRVYYDKEKVNTNEDLPKKDIKLDLNFSMNFVQDKTSN